MREFFAAEGEAENQDDEGGDQGKGEHAGDEGALVEEDFGAAGVFLGQTHEVGALAATRCVE